MEQQAEVIVLLPSGRSFTDAEVRRLESAMAARFPNLICSFVDSDDDRPDGFFVVPVVGTVGDGTGRLVEEVPDVTLLSEVTAALSEIHLGQLH